MYRENGWCSKATPEVAARRDYDGVMLRFLVDEMEGDMWQEEERQRAEQARQGLASVVVLCLIEVAMSETVVNRGAQSCVEAVAEIHISYWDFDSQPRKVEGYEKQDSSQKMHSATS
jgi:hypothetical protein